MLADFRTKRFVSGSRTANRRHVEIEPPIGFFVIKYTSPQVWTLSDVCHRGELLRQTRTQTIDAPNKIRIPLSSRRTRPANAQPAQSPTLQSYSPGRMRSGLLNSRLELELLAIGSPQRRPSSICALRGMGQHNPLLVELRHLAVRTSPPSNAISDTSAIYSRPMILMTPRQFDRCPCSSIGAPKRVTCTSGNDNQKTPTPLSQPPVIHQLVENRSQDADGTPRREKEDLSYRS